MIPLALLCSFVAAQTPLPTRRLLPVPDVGEWKTIKGDFHMHTVFSDGVVWPDTRVYEAWRDGLDAIAITDHDDYHPHKSTVSVDLRNSFDLAKPAADQMGILLVPGFEVTKGDIHVNALFVKDPNATAGKPLLESLRTMKQQGAFLFWNHPAWKGRTDWYPEIEEAHKEGLMHGVEVVNTDQLEPQTLAWLEPKKLTILANSDVHQLMETPPGKHRSPVTLVFARSRDVEGIREAMTARRTLAWRQDELWGSADLMVGLFRASVQSLNTPAVADGQALARFRNTSAIPFHAKLVAAPEWLKPPKEAVISAEAESGLMMAVTKAKPTGRARAEVEWELTNLHVPMGGNVRVKMMIDVDGR